MQRRLVFVSRYRGFLGALVVLIHAGITYGAAGAWYYVQPAGDPWLRTLASFLSFAARSFVPGAFFFLSGYFVPGSLEHRGTWGLLRERCMRLLIPLAVYALVANPLLVRVVAFRGSGGSVRSGLIFGPGPAWFLAALFVFLLVFLGARWAFPGRPAATARGIPSQPRILMSIVVFAFLSFLLRSLFPADDGISRLPMYAILFAAGIKAGTEQWLEDIASLPIGAWSVLAGGGLLLFPVLGMGGSFSLGDISFGGLHWQSAARELWSAATGMALFIVTLILFSRARWVIPGTGESFSSSSYAIFLLHPPIVVLLALAMRDVPLSPAVAWLTLSLAGTCVPWGLAAALKKAAGLSRVF